VKNNVSFQLIEVKETELQGMIKRIVDVETCFEMETNVEETKMMDISRQTFSIQIMVDQKHLQNVECLNYLCRIITHDARFKLEMKSRIAMAKAAFKKKKKKKKLLSSTR
jgi:hypothetical protein